MAPGLADNARRRRDTRCLAIVFVLMLLSACSGACLTARDAEQHAALASAELPQQAVGVGPGRLLADTLRADIEFWPTYAKADHAWRARILAADLGASVVQERDLKLAHVEQAVAGRRPSEPLRCLVLEHIEIGDGSRGRYERLMLCRCPQRDRAGLEAIGFVAVPDLDWRLFEALAQSLTITGDSWNGRLHNCLFVLLLHFFDGTRWHTTQLFNFFEIGDGETDDAVRGNAVYMLLRMANRRVGRTTFAVRWYAGLAEEDHETAKWLRTRASSDKAGGAGRPK